MSATVVISIVFGPFAPFVATAAVAREPVDKEGGTVYANAQPITIGTLTSLSAPIPASNYPSTINVSGVTGNITKLTVTLNGVTQARLSDLDMLLVGPSGAKFIFFADGGGSAPVDDKVYLFDDAATATMPQTGVPESGTYRPTSGDAIADTFPSPAPAGPYAQAPADSFASVFNGTAPNGDWSLFAVDDQLSFTGYVNLGWSLTITTAGQPATFSNPNYIGFHDSHVPSTPYGTAINIGGVSGVISDLSVTIHGFSHTDPQDVDMLLVGPSGMGLVFMSDVGSSASVTGVDLTFSDSAPGTLGVPLVTGTYRPTNIFGFADLFPPTAPFRPYHEAVNSPLSRFNGTSPNGEWRLYVVDARTGDAGSIAGGWSLQIETTPAVPPGQPSCVNPAFIQASPGGTPAGAGPAGIVLADFNGDSIPDAAVANQISNDVSIHLGVGNGTFTAPTQIVVGSGPYSLVAARFNADNFIDLAVANSGSNNVSILLGNGNGTFSGPVNFLAGAAPISIASGDFNGDSSQDLVVANFGSFFLGNVTVLTGNGAGGFAATGTLRTRTQPSYVVTGHLNSDSNLDIAVANFGSDSVSTFFGNGSGGFQLNQNLATGSGPVAIELVPAAAGQFPSLLIANYNNDTVTSCAGSANGIFSCGTSPVNGANPISIVTADFLGSGVRSSAIALSGSNQVIVTSGAFTVGQYPNAVRTADMNNDGRPDLVTANYGSNDLSVLLNSCKVAPGNLFDFDGDRRTDNAVFRPLTSGWFIRSLNPAGVSRIFGRPTDIFVSADYDGDGRTDYGYFRPENGLWSVSSPNQLPIHFQQFGQQGDIPSPADFDGDGRTDIAVWRPSDGNWYIRRSSYNSIVIAKFGMNGDRPAPADFDGDRIADIAVFRPSTGVWYVWRSSDQGYTIVNFGIEEDKTLPADFDGDGKADIAVWRPSTGAWYILRSSDGGFNAVTWGTTTDLPVSGDFDGDGRFDYAVFRPSEGSWWVLKSSDGAPAVTPWGSAGDYPIPNSAVR